MKDLITLMEPKYIEVWGKFAPRGGISIHPYCNHSNGEPRYLEMAQYRMMNRDLNTSL
jgi:7-cyano-7-deazaguanine reductase